MPSAVELSGILCHMLAWAEKTGGPASSDSCKADSSVNKMGLARKKDGKQTASSCKGSCRKARRTNGIIINFALKYLENQSCRAVRNKYALYCRNMKFVGNSNQICQHTRLHLKTKLHGGLDPELHTYRCKDCMPPA